MVIGILRVKNEGRWIERVLLSILPLCEKIIVMDDHSDDDTLYRCQSMPRVAAFESPFFGLDEARDKNLLLEMAERDNPEWCIFIDGDEVLESGSEGRLREAMSGSASCLSLRVRYLWDQEDMVRVDGVYGDFHRESVFRPTGARFETKAGGANFHCGNVPVANRRPRAVLREVSLLHFGYLHREDRVRKYVFYNRADPQNMAENEYKHIVVGDIFPSDSKFHYGGPLKLQSLQC